MYASNLLQALLWYLRLLFQTHVKPKGSKLKSKAIFTLNVNVCQILEQILCKNIESPKVVKNIPVVKLRWFQIDNRNVITSSVHVMY